MKFISKVLVSTFDGDVSYHDDMFGDGVWFNIEKPSFIHSYDYREFNGRKISQIAIFLQDYLDEQIEVDIKFLQLMPRKE